MSVLFSALEKSRQARAQNRGESDDGTAGTGVETGGKAAETSRPPAEDVPAPLPLRDAPDPSQPVGAADAVDRGGEGTNAGRLNTGEVDERAGDDETAVSEPSGASEEDAHAARVRAEIYRRRRKGSRREEAFAEAYEPKPGALGVLGGRVRRMGKRLAVLALLGAAGVVGWNMLGGPRGDLGQRVGVTVETLTDGETYGEAITWVAAQVEHGARQVLAIVLPYQDLGQTARGEQGEASGPVGDDDTIEIMDPLDGDPVIGDAPPAAGNRTAESGRTDNAEAVGNAPSTPAQPDDPPQADISVGTQTGTDSGSEDVTTDEGAAEAEATAEARAEASAAEESVTASAARADEDGSAQPDAAQPDAAQPDPGQTGETTAAVAVPAPDPIPPRPGVKPEAVKQRAAVQDAAPAPEPSPTPEPSRAAASPTQAPADPPTALTPETNGTGGQRAPQSGGVADLELETSAGAALAAANHRAAAQALRNDDPNRAARLYLDILKDSPRDPDALFGLALALSEMGLHAEARDTYRDLLNVEPGNRRALGNLVALAARGAPEGAVTRLRTLAERHPGFAPVHAQLANVQARQGDMSGALSAMRRAVRAAPDSLRFRYNLAVLYDRAEQPGAAARAYRRVLEIARRTGETDGLPMGSVRQRLRYLGG